MRTLILIGLMSLGALARAQSDSKEPETLTIATKHTVTASDTLWSLSGQYYKDPDHWRRIYLANKDKIKDPSHLTVGQVLLIPGLEKAALVPGEPAAEETSAE